MCNKGQGSRGRVNNCERKLGLYEFVWRRRLRTHSYLDFFSSDTRTRIVKKAVQYKLAKRVESDLG